MIRAAFFILLLAPLVSGQILPPSEEHVNAEVEVVGPSSLALSPGASFPVLVDVVATLSCYDGRDAPEPLRITMNQGSAHKQSYHSEPEVSFYVWQFEPSEIDLDWQADGNGGFAINDTVEFMLTSEGGTDSWVNGTGQFSTMPVSSFTERCSGDGYSIPFATGGEFPIRVPPDADWVSPWGDEGQANLASENDEPRPVPWVRLLSGLLIIAAFTVFMVLRR